MATNTGKKARKQAANTDEGFATVFREASPLNEVQQEYMDAIRHNYIVFGKGSAGTGKTFLAASYAAGELYRKHVNKIILTRPNVETGRGLGFLPGDLEEKYAGP